MRYSLIRLTEDGVNDADGLTRFALEEEILLHRWCIHNTNKSQARTVVQYTPFTETLKHKGVPQQLQVHGLNCTTGCMFWNVSSYGRRKKRDEVAHGLGWLLFGLLEMN